MPILLLLGGGTPLAPIPPITPPITPGGVLGCGIARAEIWTKGGTQRVLDLPNITATEWTRVRSDTSDGSVTLDLAGMAEVLKALKAPLMLPMHYFSTYSLRHFLDLLGEKTYEVEMAETSSVVISKATLPTKPKLLVMPGRMF